MWHLADVLRALGRPDEAEPLASETLRLWEQVLGPDHEWTGWALGSMAELRLAQHEPAEAAVLAERALVIHERNFGPLHAQVAAIKNLLARARLASGQAGAAEPPGVD
jgi:hypothetical protein